MFIVSPRYGLCNQLQTIVKGILLGIKYNRNLYINNFQIDANNGELCDINDILDIKNINIFLHNIIKTPIKILVAIDHSIINNLSDYYLPNINYNNIPTMNYINDTIELNKTMKIIYLGNIVSLNTYKSFNYCYDDYSCNNFYNLIISNIQFHENFYKMKDNIKQQLELTQFNCIHLRIEDDALNFFSKCYNLSVQDYNTQLLNFYNDNIKIYSQNKIYICSGMLNFNNKINFNYYEDLMKNNMLLCDKKNISLDEYYLKNRELVAIIDLLIAYDSECFVGSHISSFSQVIKHNCKYKKKKCILFNPDHI